MTSTTPITELLETLRKPASHPLAEIAAILARAEEAAPLLLAHFAQPAQVYTTMLVQKDHTIFYGLYLLAAMREKRLFPLLVELMRFEDETFEDFWGDILFADGPRLLLSTYDGNLHTLQSLLHDPKAPDESRTVALDAYACLVMHGLVERSQLVADLDLLWQKGFARDGSQHFLPLEFMGVCGDLQVAEFQDACMQLRKRFPKEVHERDIVEAYAKSPAESRKFFLEDSHHQPITDVAAELLRYHNSNPQPAVREAPKVGRNDPCPCGSGKKFKKCCDQ